MFDVLKLLETLWLRNREFNRLVIDYRYLERNCQKESMMNRVVHHGLFLIWGVSTNWGQFMRSRDFMHLTMSETQVFVDTFQYFSGLHHFGCQHDTGAVEGNVSCIIRKADF